jgi:ribosomal-protein-alanine N-acetyltransferase
MQIRSLELGDIAAVAKMEAAYSGNPWSDRALFTYFVRDDTILLVADENDDKPNDQDWDPRVVGFMGLIMTAPESDILDITVLPDRRNAGIGRALMVEMFRRAEAAGVHTTYLEVRVSNAPARHLYQKMGFQQIGFRKGYYSDPEEDAIVMAKRPEPDQK